MTVGLLNALCESQVSIGNEMAVAATSADNVSSLLLATSAAWAGEKITWSGTGVPPSIPTQTGQGGENCIPVNGVSYTTTQIQWMVTWIAGQMNSNQTHREIETLQAESSAWTNMGSSLTSLANTQESPIKTLQQSEASGIQQINSSISNTAALGQGLADLNGATANLVTLLMG